MIKTIRFWLIIGFPVLCAILFNYSLFDWKFWVLDTYYVLSILIAYREGMVDFKKELENQIDEL